MNLSVDQLVNGLERTARNLPGLLAEWEAFDSDLQDEYRDQLLWTLGARTEVIARAGEDRFFEIAQRVAIATAMMFDLRDDILAKMGIPASCIVPYATYVSDQSNADPAYAMAV